MIINGRFVNSVPLSKTAYDAEKKFIEENLRDEVDMSAHAEMTMQSSGLNVLEFPRVARIAADNPRIKDEKMINMFS